MKHLRWDELIDAAGASSEQQAHLDVCARCRCELRIARRALAAPPPELAPPPLELERAMAALSSTRVKLQESVAQSLSHRTVGSPTLIPDAPPTVAQAAVAEPPAPASWLETGPLALGERYSEQGRLGIGGMGEVLRVRDERLGRESALKFVRAELSDRQVVIDRFVAEARITSQLQHPGVVPVYDLGELPDGRAFYTMKVVRGTTLEDALESLHGAEPDGRWTVRRLADAVYQVSQAVAYAHDSGVLHLDLKPANVMLGEFGEVQVLDWGLAQFIEGEPGEPDRPLSARNKAGQVSGTPAYMSPEQARGDWAEIGPCSDVFSLGALLYAILAGRPPYVGFTASELLIQARDHAAPAPSLHRAGVPPGLELVCLNAMSRDIETRTPSAAALAAELREWLDGARRRDRAMALVRQADEQVRAVAALRADARAMVKDAAAATEKEAAWALEDEAERRAQQSDVAQVAWIQKLQAALTIDPELPEAHLRLARHYRGEHARAEAGRDRALAAQLELLLAAHDTGEHAQYRRAIGHLSLSTSRPCRVVLHRYEARARRLVAVPFSVLQAPLVGLELPVGSYLLRLSAEGCHDVNYPVQIGRLEHWEGRAPGEAEGAPVWLPPLGSLTDGERYLPAGWARVGGDVDAPESLGAARVWVDALVAQRVCVTNADYIAFLDDLVDRGEESRALRLAPQERAGAYNPMYGRDSSGHFILQADAEGDLWRPDWPVVLVDLEGASAYGAWLAERTGQAWRLPFEWEWEKAARGVDGRVFPWGDFLDPTFCCIMESPAAAARALSVGGSEDDESPYGVRDMAGLVREWCQDVYTQEGALMSGERAVGSAWDPNDLAARRVIKGGGFLSNRRVARAANRYGPTGAMRSANMGFRLVRSIRGSESGA
jgi:eukaryotic-like serine/threonine-protein kinase